MIPRACKRLAEVDFPIAVVSKHAAREKSIRHGHPSTLHLWWARRPLASSRAVLLALLLPDPGDPHCPEPFRRAARRELPRVGCGAGRTHGDLRRGLLRFIGDFANWNVAADATYLAVGRALVRAAHGDEAPLVVDPFAGGGSIPLEALRLGCEAFASDLNPVACLILKVMLEDIPRHGPGLAEELRRVGGEIKAAAEKELADLYPADPDGATPIAYLWARTVRCEAPNCGAEIPLLRSLWLCRKARRRRALRSRVVRAVGETPRVEFEIVEPAADRDVRSGTVARAKATCLCCNTVLPPERVRAQLAAQRGGADAPWGRPPTPGQQKVLDAIKDHIRQHAMPPTRNEIAHSLGFSNGTSVAQQLKGLAARGWIEILPHKNRGIRVLDDQQIPLIRPLAEVAAGTPIVCDANTVERMPAAITARFRTRPDYLLTVRGDSMDRAGIGDGDIVAVKKTPDARSGQIVVARFGDEVTLKRFARIDERHVELRPESRNPAHKVMKLDLAKHILDIDGIAVGALITTLRDPGDRIRSHRQPPSPVTTSGPAKPRRTLR